MKTFVSAIILVTSATAIQVSYDGMSKYDAYAELASQAYGYVSYGSDGYQPSTGYGSGPYGGDNYGSGPYGGDGYGFASYSSVGYGSDFYDEDYSLGWSGYDDEWDSSD